MTPPPKFSTVYSGYLLAQRSRNLTRSYLAMLERTRDCLIMRQGDLEIDAIHADHLRLFLVWLSGQDTTAGIQGPPLNHRGKALSGATINIHYRNLRAFFRWAEDEELVARSPMRKVRSPRYDERLPDALTEAEVQVLLDKVKTSGDRNAWRDYCIHQFFLDTGVRLAELCGLDLDHINMDEGYARVFGKGRKERIVPLGVELRRDISRYLLKHREAAAGQAALFTNEYGGRLRSQGVRMMVVRDLKRYVPRELAHCGPHTERHTAATLRLRHTRDLKTTSLILGHSTTRTTERYIHLTGADVLRDASGSAMDVLMRKTKRD